MYLLGYDIGSSTIKAALIQADSHEVKGSLNYPEQAMNMIARQRGWAEQQPEVWWHDFCVATQRLLQETGIEANQIQGIGISYQMHGLVLIDQRQQVLRPSIIWCDSRAIAIGEQAFKALGESYCLEHLLNSPGNFTASKLKWVKDNEPEIYERIDKFLLPGDFIAMKLTGKATTTLSGLSEGILWDFKQKQLAVSVLDHYDISKDLLPDLVPAFAIQGRITNKAAEQTGLAAGTPITYRAGDQPNNALALNVFRPGEVAATSSTSGVVYGIVEQPIFDRHSRVNSFAHVNYEENQDRIGVLLCVNGAGMEYSWIKHQVARKEHSYEDMERMASSVPVGSDGLCLLPFGNGAERILGNQHINAHIFNLDYNRHSRAHLYRASLEGVAFSFVYGVRILKELGLNIDVIRVADDNMFQSGIFSSTIATMLHSEIEVVQTNGAIGAARAAGVAVGAYSSLEEALSKVQPEAIYEPQPNAAPFQQAYSFWDSRLQMMLGEQPTKKSRTSSKGDQINGNLDKAEQLLKELAAANLQMNEFKDFLKDLKTDLRQLDTIAKSQEVHKLIRRIDTTLEQAPVWTDFEEQFDLLHDNFLKKLNNTYPGLSLQELKICTYLKMKLSTKEIAQRLNLSIRGAETCRYRLRKKLGIPKGENLFSFLDQFGSN